MIKLKIPLLFFTLVILNGCAKDAVQVDTKSPEAIVQEDKMAKIEKYISIMWKTPVEKVKYDTSKQEFVFGEDGQSRMTKAAMEELYDKSNEYKFIYEK